MSHERYRKTLNNAPAQSSRTDHSHTSLYMADAATAWLPANCSAAAVRASAPKPARASHPSSGKCEVRHRVGAKPKGNWHRRRLPICPEGNSERSRNWMLNELVKNPFCHPTNVSARKDPGRGTERVVGHYREHRLVMACQWKRF